MEDTENQFQQLRELESKIHTYLDTTLKRCCFEHNFVIVR